MQIGAACHVGGHDVGGEADVATRWGSAGCGSMRIWGRAAGQSSTEQPNTEQPSTEHPRTKQHSMEQPLEHNTPLFKRCGSRGGGPAGRGLTPAAGGLPSTPHTQPA